MALLKEIVYPNGITTKYHKITNITNDKQVVVTVKSYLDESYREKELDSIEQFNKLSHTITTEGGVTDEEIQEMLDRQMELSQNTDLSIKEQTFVLDELKDYTFEEAYDYLKTLDDFSGAEDV